MSRVEPKTNSDPYLSLVVCSRNDDHGGDLLPRMQLFVNGLLEQCRRHQLQAELVVVEWNPPADRPRLKEALSWPVNGGPCPVRIIDVSNQIHSRLEYSDRLPLFQMIAKNAGIRRARGRFVLATNIDILFSDELMRFLASERLKENRMYRIDRNDVRSDIPTTASLDDQLAYCRDNIIRVNARNGTKNVLTGHYHVVYNPASWGGRLRERIKELIGSEVTTRTRLHTNACGDFTLMSRKSWFDVRAYPEFEMYSFHLDSVLCHAAHHGGAREQVLDDPMRIYHIEHGIGSGFTPEGHQQLDARLSEAKIPQLEHDQFAAWAIQMRRERRPMIFNEETWGLAQYDLPETVIRSKGNNG